MAGKFLRWLVTKFETKKDDEIAQNVLNFQWIRCRLNNLEPTGYVNSPHVWD